MYVFIVVAFDCLRDVGPVGAKTALDAAKYPETLGISMEIFQEK